MTEQQGSSWGTRGKPQESILLFISQDIAVGGTVQYQQGHRTLPDAPLQ